MKVKTALTELLGIEFPVILAPMFLVSNEKMCIAALKSGITCCIPALNWRTDELMRKGISSIKNQVPNGVFGINLIVNVSNIHLKRQLQTCLDLKVPYIITSLGSPEEVIKLCKPLGIKVLCDVVSLEYAKKVENLGADAIIAVNKEAGGHSGNLLAKDFIPLLKKVCKIPIISAGGVGNGTQMHERIFNDGADGVSVGSIFIATKESDVSKEYKQACVDYGAKDIVMTTKISGTPCTVINTPYVQKVGTKQSWLEKLLSKNKTLRKYVKMLTYYKGMKAVEQAAFSSTYQNVWCAGTTIEYVKKIRSVSEIVEEIKTEYISKLS